MMTNNSRNMNQTNIHNFNLFENNEYILNNNTFSFFLLPLPLLESIIKKISKKIINQTHENLFEL